METNVCISRTSTYCIAYRVVWTVKHRQQVLTDDLREFLKNELLSIGGKKGIEIMRISFFDADGVECIVSAPPKLSIREIVMCLKGVSGRKLLMKVPELKSELESGELWNHSYYVETLGTERDLDDFLKRQTTCY